MSTTPELYVSPGFLDAAQSAGVVGMTPSPADIDVVLRYGGERYRNGELSTALGAVMLLHPEEQLGDSGLRVHQVLPHDVTSMPPEQLVLAGAGRSPEEITAAHPQHLTATPAEATKVAVAWSLYDAADAKGSPTLDTMRAGLEKATELRQILKGPASLDALFGSLLNTAGTVASSAPQLKREHDKPVIELAEPVMLTHSGDAPRGL